MQENAEIRQKGRFILWLLPADILGDSGCSDV